MKTKCIIVEDEPIAVEILEHYMRNMPDLELVAKCSNAIEALQVLRNNEIDLMFLDIHMPKISGLDLLKTLNRPPKVIITTAHRKYAIDGFELNVVDYLLKPFSFERFLKGIDKYYQHIKAPAGVNTEMIEAKEDNFFIYVKTDRKILKVFLDEIYYLESMKDYVIIHKKDEKIITKQQIGNFEQQLPSKYFLRIHRSYIVAISKIQAVTKSSVEINQKELPISRTYKNEVWKTLQIDGL